MFFVTVFAFVLLFAFDIANEKHDAIQVVSSWPVWLRWPVYVLFILVMLLLIQREGTAPFIYFQF